MMYFLFYKKNIPGRFKAFHYCNAGTFFELIMGMIKPFLSKKFQERVRRIHSSNYVLNIKIVYIDISF